MAPTSIGKHIDMLMLPPLSQANSIVAYIGAKVSQKQMKSVLLRYTSYSEIVSSMSSPQHYIIFKHKEGSSFGTVMTCTGGIGK